MFWSTIVQNHIRCRVRNETSSNNRGKFRRRNRSKRGWWSFADKIKDQWDDRLWFLPTGRTACGLSSAHVCHLWNFSMPSLVKLHCSVTSSLVRMAGSLANWWSSHCHLCQLVTVPETDVRGMDIVVHVMFDTQHSVILPAVQILFWCLNWDPLPRRPRYFLPQLECGRPGSTVIRRTASVSQIRWSAQRKFLRFGTRPLGYVSSNRITSAAEFLLHSRSTRRMSTCSTHVYSTAIWVSTETLRTLALELTVLTPAFGTRVQRTKLKKCKQIICENSFVRHTDWTSPAA
jgi:hypothetical protein